MHSDINSIKKMPKSERPRERLCRYGVEYLTNIELLSIILGTGYKDKSVLKLANDILSIDKLGIIYLQDITIQELMSVQGVGISKATKILASIEFGKRVNNSCEIEKIKVNRPFVVSEILMDKMKTLTKEYFKVILLDTKNQIICIDNISIGTLNASIVHPRDVFNVAIRKNSNSIILVHNHPSGDPNPSKEDVAITYRLQKAGKILGIEVLDHVIIGNNKYISFKEEKLI